MLRLALVIGVSLLSSVQAKSQDALATFVFIFVTPTIDVTHSSGTELVVHDPISPGLTTTVRSPNKCVFEETTIKDKNSSTVWKRHWDFNKAFWGEAEFIEQWNRRNLRLPGEKGVFYDEGRGSQDYVDDTPIPSDRAVKAIKYFQSFCPGTKRNSAF